MPNSPDTTVPEQLSWIEYRKYVIESLEEHHEILSQIHKGLEEAHNERIELKSRLDKIDTVSQTVKLVVIFFWTVFGGSGIALLLVQQYLKH